MATRKNASKVSKRASLDFDWNEQNNRKNSKKATKTAKKLGFKVILCALIVLLINAAVGVGAGYFLTRNDCFEIVGNDEITLTLGENYYDEGVNVVAFNKKCEDIIVESNLSKNADGSFTSNAVGTFYIIYKADNIKYNSIFKIQKIRLITFVEPSEGSVEVSEGEV